MKPELGDWHTVPVTRALRAMHDAAGEPGARFYQRDVDEHGHLMVIVALCHDLEWPRPLWHLSISHRTNTHPPQPGRYPSWDEIVDARYRFLDDSLRVGMLLPPRAEWVNEHPTTFHLWEILDGLR